MKTNTPQTQRIEAYLNGEMSSEGKAAFEQEMEQDQNLAQAVQLYRLEKKAAHLLLEEEFGNQVRHYRQTRPSDSDMDGPQTKRIAPLWGRRLAVAASILLLVSMGTLFWSSYEYSNTALANAQFQYDFSSVARNIQQNNRSNNTILQQGVKLFKADKIPEAIALLNGISSGDTAFVEAQYYLGQLYYQQQQFSEAVDRFEKVLTHQDFRFQEQAEWYLVLSMLADGKTNNRFDNLLNKIVKDQVSVYQPNALQLQQQLQSFWRKLIF